MTRIAVVSFTGNSGIAHYTGSLCRYLRGPGLEVSLVTNRNLDWPGDELTCQVFKIFGRSRYLFLDYPRFLSLILKEGFQAVHFQNWIKFPWIDLHLIRLFRSRGIRTVITAHDVLPMGSRFSNETVFKKIYREVDAIIVHSASARKRIQDLTQAACAPIYQIPHGVYDIFVPKVHLTMSEARKALGLPLEGRLGIIFGHISPRKGVEGFLHAFDRFLKIDPSLVLCVAGHNEYPAGYLEGIIRDKGLAGKVVLLDRRLSFTEVQQLFTASDLVILPHKEGTTSGGLKMAYAFHKPVLACRTGELPEVILGEKTGWVIDDSFPQDQISAMMRQWGSAQQVDTIKDNIAGVVRRKYSWQLIARQTMDVYSSLCVLS